MKLIELIANLKTIDGAELLISKEIPGVEYDLVDLYLVNNLDINSEVKFFNAEEIPNNLIIEIDGNKYVNLFPLNLTEELINDFIKLSNANISDIEIAKKLLEYRIKDA